MPSKKDYCELCLDLRWHDVPLDLTNCDITLCRNCHIAVERETKKQSIQKYEAFNVVKARLTNPKFVTVAELGIEPNRVIEILVELGFVKVESNRITPTPLGIDIGIIKPVEGGFLVRKEPRINHDQSIASN